MLDLFGLSIISTQSFILRTEKIVTLVACVAVAVRAMNGVPDGTKERNSLSLEKLSLNAAFLTLFEVPLKIKYCDYTGT